MKSHLLTPEHILLINADFELVISKEVVRNSWDSLNAILGHKYHQNHPESVISLSIIKRIKPKFETKGELQHIYFFQCASDI